MSLKNDERAEGDALTAVMNAMGDRESIATRIMTASEFKNIPPPEYLIEGVLSNGLTVLFAIPGIGKSLLALAIGVAIARGIPLFGQHTTKRPGGVLFVLPEAVRSWANRLCAYDLHFGYDDSPNMHFLPGEMNLGSERGWAQLTDAITAINSNCDTPIALVVIDTLAAATPGVNENSGEEMGLVMQRLQSLVAEGIGVLACHHAGKNGNYRGHALAAAVMP